MINETFEKNWNRFFWLGFIGGVIVELSNLNETSGLGLISCALIWIFFMELCKFCETKEEKPTPIKKK